MSYLRLYAIQFFQINSHRVFARVLDRDVAYSMRCEIGMAILVILDFVFPNHWQLAPRIIVTVIGSCLPFIQPYCILDKEDGFIGQ